MSLIFQKNTFFKYLYAPSDKNNQFEKKNPHPMTKITENVSLFYNKNDRVVNLQEISRHVVTEIFKMQNL